MVDVISGFNSFYKLTHCIYGPGVSTDVRSCRALKGTTDKLVSLKKKRFVKDTAMVEVLQGGPMDCWFDYITELH